MTADYTGYLPASHVSQHHSSWKPVQQRESVNVYYVEGPGLIMSGRFLYAIEEGISFSFRITVIIQVNIVFKHHMVIITVLVPYIYVSTVRIKLRIKSSGLQREMCAIPVNQNFQLVNESSVGKCGQYKVLVLDFLIRSTTSQSSS